MRVHHRGVLLFGAAAVAVLTACGGLPGTAPRQDGSVSTYLAVVTRDDPKVKATMTMDRDCKAFDAACRASWVRFGAAVAAYQQDLDRTPAPPCLAASDRALRTALDDYGTAASEVEVAIDANDLSGIDRAITTYGSANDAMDASTHATDAARC